VLGRLGGVGNVLVHDNGGSMGSHLGLKSAQQTPTSFGMLCDCFHRVLVKNNELVVIIGLRSWRPGADDGRGGLEPGGGSEHVTVGDDF
jgi:hypothetical protein